jgi:hypothetical protein
MYENAGVGGVQAFVVRARLVPHGASLPGQNTFRSWTTLKQNLAGLSPHRYTMTVAPPVPDTEKDWDLQVQLKWDKYRRLDWNTNLKAVRFDETGCPGQGAAPGLPSVSQAVPMAGTPSG